MEFAFKTEALYIDDDSWNPQSAIAGQTHAGRQAQN